jgi:hypothetical protein
LKRAVLKMSRRRIRAEDQWSRFIKHRIVYSMYILYNRILTHKSWSWFLQSATYWKRLQRVYIE